MNGDSENPVRLSELERLREGLGILQEISLELGDEKGLDELLQKVVDLIVDFLKVRRASIMLVEQDDVLKIHAFFGMPAEVAQKAVVRMGEGIAGRVALTKQPFLIRDVSEIKQLKSNVRSRYDTNSFISIPMQAQNEVVGVINANDKLDRSVFDQYDMELLTVVAGHAAAVVKNYYLYSALKGTVKRLNQSNRRLSIAQSRTRVVIDHVIDAMISTDASGRVTLFNHSARGYFPDLKIGRSLFTHMPSDKFGVWMRQRHKAAGLGESLIAEYRLTISETKTVLLQVRTVLIQSQKKVAPGFLHVFSDVTWERSEEDKKQEFLALISHELRTPITVIKTYISSMISGAMGDLNEIQVEGLQDMQEAAKRLQREVDNLVLSSRIDREDFEPEFSQFNLILEIEKQVASIESFAAEQEVEVKLCLECDSPPIRGDRSLLRVAISNLLSNAIKFSSPGSVVTVGSRRVDQNDETFIEMSVLDKGPGISPREINQIFNRFSQGESHLRRKTGGTGIGLSMVKRIVELNEGRLEVETELGKGSRFAMLLKTAKGQEE